MIRTLIRAALPAMFACLPLPLAAQDRSSTDLTLDIPGGPTLAGTLTMPAGKGPFPAVLLVSGAGPHDRDSEHDGHRPFAALADHLAQSGIAVLRLDDRGVDGSGGDLATASWTTLADDAAAAAALLEATQGIDREAIGIIGHSQGGIIAPLAQIRCTCFDFFVSLAGPSGDFVEMTLRQRRRAAMAQGAPEAALARTEPVLEAAYRALGAAPDFASAREAVRAILTDEALATLGAQPEMREVAVAQLATEGMFDALRHAPQRTLPAIDIPVLALVGSRDEVIDPAENFAAIRSALPHGTDFTALEIEGLDHFFLTATAPEADIAPAALEAIAAWIAPRQSSTLGRR